MSIKKFEITTEKDENGEQYSPEYDNWNNEKQDIYFKNKPYPSYKEREIWWTSIGLNIGNEVYGKNTDFSRPVLIIKKMGQLFFAVPLTSIYKDDDNPHFMKIIDKKDTKSSWAMLTQVRVFSAQRLLKKHNAVGRIHETVLNTLKEKITKILF